MGPVASQEAIKMLGTNGGGFFNANSAHPYENPTPLSNFVQMLSIFLIPAALCFAFGRMVGDIRQGWAVLAAMTAIFVVMAAVVMIAEQQAHPALGRARRRSGAERAAIGRQHGRQGNPLRHQRLGPVRRRSPRPRPAAPSMRCTTRSLPLGGMVPLVLIQFGEVMFGGVGSGLYGMLMFAILAVFIAGLMIGRTPEYLGKKIQSFDMKMTSIAILVTPMLVLVGTAIAVMLDAGTRRHRQPRRPRLLGNPVRLQLGRQQQRQRLRRPVRQYAVLQRHRWPSRCGSAASR